MSQKLLNMLDIFKHSGLVYQNIIDVHYYLIVEEYIIDECLENRGIINESKMLYEILIGPPNGGKDCLPFTILLYVNKGQV